MSDNRIEQALADLPGIIAGAVASAVAALRPAEPAAQEQSAEIGELIGALALARPNFDALEKEHSAGKEGGKRWRYASLDAAIGATAEALAAQGLVVIQAPVSVDDDRGFVTIETGLYHSSGQFLRRRLRMPCGNDPQGVGSAISYGRRYSYLPLVNTAPADDDDGQAAQASAQRQRAQRKQDRSRARDRQPSSPPPSAERKPAKVAESPAAQKQNQAAEVTWTGAWDAIRAEQARVPGSVDEIGHEYAANVLLPRLTAKTGWPVAAIERAVGQELDLMVEDLPRVDSRNRPFAQTWVERALTRFRDHAEIIAGYDAAESEAEPDSAAPAESPEGPALAEILDPLSGADGGFPGEDLGGAWGRIDAARQALEEHHPDQLAPVTGGNKLAIYRAGKARGLDSGGVEEFVAESLLLDAFAELPDILAPAVVEALEAFPVEPTGSTAKPEASDAPSTDAPAGIPKGWRDQRLSELSTVVRALIAQGKIAEEDVPQSGASGPTKADYTAAIEAAIAKHGIQEG